MIYTIGHKANYLKAIAESPTNSIYKTGKTAYPGHEDYYPGGYAFQTPQDAERRIDEHDKRGVWAVFGLDASWETDTYPDPGGGWWHCLIPETRIIVLDESYQSTHPLYR